MFPSDHKRVSVRQSSQVLPTLVIGSGSVNETPILFDALPQASTLATLIRSAKWGFAYVEDGSFGNPSLSQAGCCRHLLVSGVIGGSEIWLWCGFVQHDVDALDVRSAAVREDVSPFYVPKRSRNDKSSFTESSGGKQGHDSSFGFVSGSVEYSSRGADA